MKTFLKVILGIALVMGLGVALVMGLTGGLVDTAEGFLSAARDGDYERARGYLVAELQEDTSPQALARFIEERGLDGYQEASWNSRSISGGRGELQGTVATAAGGAIPVSLVLVKANDEWRILSIDATRPSLGGETSSSVPGERDLIALTAAANHAFAESLAQGSMATFHGHVSQLWQDQITVQELEEAFAPFLELDLDWLGLVRNYPIRFDGEPTIDERGVLIVNGHYPTQPEAYHFRQLYVHEGLGWKLLGYHAEFK